MELFKISNRQKTYVIVNNQALWNSSAVDKRDFELTVSRALNVEEIEIKQRSLASVKRARLKDKKNILDGEKKETAT